MLPFSLREDNLGHVGALSTKLTRTSNKYRLLSFIGVVLCLVEPVQTSR